MVLTRLNTKNPQTYFDIAFEATLSFQKSNRRSTDISRGTALISILDTLLENRALFEITDAKYERVVYFIQEHVSEIIKDTSSFANVLVSKYI